MAGLQALQLAILKNKKILSRSAVLDCSRSEGGRVGLADLDSFADISRPHPTVYKVARSAAATCLPEEPGDNHAGEVGLSTLAAKMRVPSQAMLAMLKCRLDIPTWISLARSGRPNCISLRLFCLTLSHRNHLAEVQHPVRTV